MQRKSIMRTSKWMWLALSSLILIVGVVTVHARQGDSSELIIGQPAFGNITAGSTLTYTYSISDARAVTLQVIGEVVQPTINIVSGGQPVASQPNAEGNKIVSLTALLNAGAYTIQVGSLNNTEGSVIVVVESSTPVTTGGQLPIATVITGQLTSATNSATYTFSALPEPAFLYFESSLPTGGPTLHLKNTATGNESVINGADVSGARFRIPQGSTSYEIDMAFTGTDQPQTFTLCLTTVSASSCEAGSVPPDNTNDVSGTPDASNPSACNITPLNANGANIRKYGDTASRIVIGLPANDIASAIGVSPAGNFYKVSYKNATGWVATVAVGTSGDCSGVPVVNPPAFVPTPTPTPIPPTKAPEPTGPCLITMADKAFVYQRPDAKPDYLSDQVQKNYQLSPVGRLKDNSWWKTSYLDSWIQTKYIGHEAKISGNCNHLPVVSYP